MKTPGNAIIGLSLYKAGKDCGGKVTRSPMKMHVAPIPIAVKGFRIFFWRIAPTLTLPIAIPTETRDRTVPP